MAGNMAKSQQSRVRAEKKKPRNRPLIFDKPDWPEKRKRVLLYVSGCYYIEDAIIASGLSTQWWYKWQAIAEKEIERAQVLAEEEGSDDFKEYVEPELLVAVEFVEAVRKAQSEVVALNAAKIRKSNPLEYNARVRPEQWGRKDRMLLGNDPDAPFDTAVRVYLPDNGRGPKRKPEKEQDETRTKK